jgi:hypothetical protein
VSSCKQEGSYSYINTNPAGTTNKLRNSNVSPYYQGYQNYQRQYQYEQNYQPYSRAYRNPYSAPPRNYSPYYDSDIYYVPPPEYYNTPDDYNYMNTDKQ